MNISEVERMKALIRQYEKEKQESEAKLQRALEEVKEETELQVRRKMVVELQERQASGENEKSQMMGLIEGMKRNYEMILKGMKEKQKTKEEEFEDEVLRLKRQISDLEDDNLSLSLRLTAITSIPERWCGW